MARVLAPATGIGPPQTAETAATTRACSRLGPWSGKLLGRRVIGLPADTVTHGHQSRVGHLAASAPIDADYGRLTTMPSREDGAWIAHTNEPILDVLVIQRVRSA